MHHQPSSFDDCFCKQEKISICTQGLLINFFRNFTIVGMNYKNLEQSSSTLHSS